MGLLGSEKSFMM